MKKQISLFIFMMAAMFFTACTKQAPVAVTPAADVEKQVTEQWNKVLQAVMAADAESYATFFSDSGFIQMYSGGMSFSSKKVYIDTVRAWFFPRAKAEMTNPVVKVNVLGEGLAMLGQTSRFAVSYKDGTEDAIDHCVSVLFRKEGESWVIVHGHESWAWLGE